MLLPTREFSGPRTYQRWGRKQSAYSPRRTRRYHSTPSSCGSPSGAGLRRIDTYEGPTPDVAAELARNVRAELESTYTISESGTAGTYGGSDPQSDARSISSHQQQASYHRLTTSQPAPAQALLAPARLNSPRSKAARLTASIPSRITGAASFSAPSRSLEKQEEMSEDNEDWRNHPPYRTARENGDFEKKWTASCSCGRVKYWLSRDKPLASKYCHCVDCQSLHGAPFQWAAIFHKEDLHFEKGAEGLAFYNSQDKQTHHKLPCKVSCAYCHTPIMDEGRNMVLMFPGIIKYDNPEHKKWFDPQCHIFYSQRVVDIPDGKPKWSKLDGISQLVNDVGDIKDVEAVVSKKKLDETEKEEKEKDGKQKEEEKQNGKEDGKTNSA
ncbi:hypothetical protein DL764_006892 [Monosporascus ibericus]|uniref:CENP-V/GFA domain-containing protein n=1 Tax=Monosporascus ibericus TaxID=155417 RepID=A0A4Q4T3K6_9PEZI|nr:hypothetical protein DL764_006892 [Monosporascus ibericus]